jgi:hypothetical protein
MEQKNENETIASHSTLNTETTTPARSTIKKKWYWWNWKPHKTTSNRDSFLIPIPKPCCYKQWSLQNKQQVP